MPKKKTPDEDPKKQFERFIEAARKAGVEDHADDVEKAFRRITDRATTSRSGRAKRSPSE